MNHYPYNIVSFKPIDTDPVTYIIVAGITVIVVLLVYDILSHIEKHAKTNDTFGPGEPGEPGEPEEPEEPEEPDTMGQIQEGRLRYDDGFLCKTDKYVYPPHPPSVEFIDISTHEKLMGYLENGWK